MTLLLKTRDGIKGERIACEFRKMIGPHLIAKTAAHRAQRIRITGLPASA